MAKLPKGITQRGNKFRVDVTWEGNRKTGYSDTLPEAVAMRARLDADLKNPSTALYAEPEMNGAWTLGTAYDRTIQVKWRGTRGAKTAMLNAGFALSYFGRSRKLSTIDTDALDGYAAHLMGLGNSDGTINRKMAALSCMFTVAIDRDKLDKKPKMPRRKESEGRLRWLTDAEEANVLRLLNQWDKLDAADAVAVLVDTGLRLGELLRLDGSRDIDHKTPAVHVWVSKADKPRTVPLTKRAYNIIKQRSIMHKNVLFPYSEDWLRHIWDRVRSVMKLMEDDQFVTHALRHTFASRLVQRSVPIQVVQQLMGHKTLAITMRYAHLAPANFTQAIALLEPAKVDA